MSECNSGFLADGDMIGDYSSTFYDIEVVERRGSHVFARASRYGRRWFLKGIDPEGADATSLRQRLLKEFEILSRLSHPGVVSGASIEEVEGLGLCIVMEWVEGPTLQSLLDEGTLSKAERRRLLTEIVEAMAYVHSCGIVHRDLKPGNIMVRANGGRAVVVDFGLADTDDYALLKNPAGTHGYMSERQQTASSPFTGDDVYALGVIMQSLYPEYRDIMRRCTGAPERRFATASELREALRRRSERRRRLLLAVALAAAVVALAVVVGLLIHARRIGSSMTALEGQLDSVSIRAEREQSRRIAITDSLRLLGTQLDEEREYNARTKEHDELMQTTKRRLKDELEQAYQHFLRTDSNPTYGDSQAAVRLVTAMASAKESFINSMPRLDDADRESLENTYTLYQGEILHRWTNSQKK